MEVNPRKNLTQEQLDLFENKLKGTSSIDTIEISHPDIEETYFICRDSEDNFFKLENNIEQEFKAVNFTIKTPNYSAKIETNFDFQVDVINFQLIKQLYDLLENENNNKMKVIYRSYIKDSENAPVVGPLYFEAKGFNIKDNKLIISSSIHDLFKNKYPFKTMTTIDYKGMKYVERN